MKITTASAMSHASKAKEVLANFLTAGRPQTHFDALARHIEAFTDRGSTIRVLDLGAGSAAYWLDTPLQGLIESGAIQLVTLLDAASPSVFQGQPTSAVPFSRVQGIVPEDLVNFEDETFDVVIAFDLIEHLSREKGFKLIYEMERVATLLVGIFTPNGMVWQPPAPDNPFNAHISGWTKKDFASMGFKNVYGHVGWKWLFGPYAQPRFSKGKSRLLNLLNLTCRPWPSLSFALSAWKTLDSAVHPRYQFLNADQSVSRN